MDIVNVTDQAYAWFEEVHIEPYYNIVNSVKTRAAIESAVAAMAQLGGNRNQLLKQAKNMLPMCMIKPYLSLRIDALRKEKAFIYANLNKDLFCPICLCSISKKDDSQDYCPKCGTRLNHERILEMSTETRVIADLMICFDDIAKSCEAQLTTPYVGAIISLPIVVKRWLCEKAVRTHQKNEPIPKALSRIVEQSGDYAIDTYLPDPLFAQIKINE